MPRNDKEPHSISSEMPLRSFVSNVCIQVYAETRNIPFNQHPREGKMNPLGSGMFLPLLSVLFKYTMKGFAAGRERRVAKKTTVFCNVSITHILSVLTAKSQVFQLSKYLVACWCILMGQ